MIKEENGKMKKQKFNVYTPNGSSDIEGWRVVYSTPVIFLSGWNNAPNKDKYPNWITLIVTKCRLPGARYKFVILHHLWDLNGSGLCMDLIIKIVTFKYAN